LPLSLLLAHFLSFGKCNFYKAVFLCAVNDFL
jgi:hypothetical protein